VASVTYHIVENRTHSHTVKAWHGTTDCVPLRLCLVGENVVEPIECREGAALTRARPHRAALNDDVALCTSWQFTCEQTRLTRLYQRTGYSCLATARSISSRRSSRLRARPTNIHLHTLLSVSLYSVTEIHEKVARWSTCLRPTAAERLIRWSGSGSGLWPGSLPTVNHVAVGPMHCSKSYQT